CRFSKSLQEPERVEPTLCFRTPATAREIGHVKPWKLVLQGRLVKKYRVRSEATLQGDLLFGCFNVFRRDAIQITIFQKTQIRSCGIGIINLHPLLEFMDDLDAKLADLYIDGIGKWLANGAGRQGGRGKLMHAIALVDQQAA